ncbi:class I SAM-dependent methyltransferase [Lysinibacillus sp. KU-BSD001]|uniref:class I SAM-dependent methyltransferase n=1 Tax=Lysinibacillus sp. KU-BSD001 TaxID=3141328 RepID=UPI0036F03273
MRNSKYLNFLSKFGIGGAHPGGLALTQELFTIENINKDTRVLDVGCGTGQTAAYLAKTYGAQVTGIDIDPLMVKKAQERMRKERLPVDIMQGSIEQISLQDQTFDVIISESVLSFVHTPQALKEVFRLLRNGGQFIANELIITQPFEAVTEKEIKEFYGFESIFTEQHWLTCLQQAGFTNIRSVKKRPIDQSHSTLEFHYSHDIEPGLYEIMDQHVEMTVKYKDIWDYRIFLCTK